MLYRPAVLVHSEEKWDTQGLLTRTTGLVQLGEAQISHVLPLKSKGKSFRAGSRHLLSISYMSGTRLDALC